MRNIVVMLALGFLVMSCGTTQEVESVKPTIDESMPEPQSSKTPEKKAAFDIEEIIAQLGLSEEKEAEFLNMWSATGDKMRKVRNEYRDYPDRLRQNMVAVKNERDEGIRSILSPTQMSHFYEIMAKNRTRIDVPRSGKGGK